MTALVVHRDAQTDAASAKEALYVVFKVGGAEYALQAETVIQLESFTGCTRVPGTSAFVAGLVQIRGRVMPVVDLRVRFGVDAAPASSTRGSSWGSAASASSRSSSTAPATSSRSRRAASSRLRASSTTPRRASSKG